MSGQVPHAATQRPFFPRVESLRGLGALAVAAYHYSGLAVHGVMLFPFPAPFPPWPDVGVIQVALGRLGMALMPGHGALVVFFVISGFVLSISLRHGPQAPARLVGAFLVARVARILPVVVAAALIAFALHGFRPPGPADMRALIASMVLLDVSMNLSLWALQLEALMVPLIAALFLLERRFGPPALAAVVAVTVPLSFSPHWAVWPPLSRNFFIFPLGMLVPSWGAAMAHALAPRDAARAAALSALAVILPRSLFGMFSVWSTMMEACGAFVLVSLVAYRGDIAGLRVLDLRLVRLLGLASGSYYVMHTLFMSYFFALAAWLIAPQWSATAPALVGWAVVALWLALMLPIALAGFHLVEAPGIAVGRRLRRLFDRPGA